MAEYKTYKCDRCGALDAIHLLFPSVDENFDPAHSKYYPVAGAVDLCRKCLEVLWPREMKKRATSEQRDLWKKLLHP